MSKRKLDLSEILFAKQIGTLVVNKYKVKTNIT